MLFWLTDTGGLHTHPVVLASSPSMDDFDKAKFYRLYAIAKYKCMKKTLQLSVVLYDTRRADTDPYLDLLQPILSFRTIQTYWTLSPNISVRFTNAESFWYKCGHEALVFTSLLFHFCRQQGHAGSKTLQQQNPPVLDWRCRCRLMQVDLYNGRKTVKLCVVSLSIVHWRPTVSAVMDTHTYTPV